MKEEQYKQMVKDFNEKSNSDYLSEINFLKFRKTKKGIKVSFSLGKPYEIEQLKQNIIKAGKPYYGDF